MSSETIRTPDLDVESHDRGQREKRARSGAAFEVLSNERRRRVVQFLLRHDEEGVTLRELSRELAVWENGVSREELTLNQRKRVYTSLIQSHLPRMDELGFVVYDSKRNVVRPTERVSDLEEYLKVGSQIGVPWSAYFAGIGVIGLGIVLAKTFGIHPISLISGLGWATLIALLVAVSGLFHLVAYYNGRIRLV